MRVKVGVHSVPMSFCFLSCSIHQRKSVKLLARDTLESDFSVDTNTYHSAFGYGFGAFLSMPCSSFFMGHKIGLRTEPSNCVTPADRRHKPTGAHRSKPGSRSR